MNHASRLQHTAASVVPLDGAAMAAARDRQRQLTKPAGSLGMLEELSMLLCGVQGTCPPRALTSPAVAVFAGDHGVHAQGVTPWPQEVTAAMIENFRAGGAAVNVLARGAGVEVYVVDVGVAGDLPAGPDLIDRKVRRGTADLALGPAMSREDALAAVCAGIDVAEQLVDRGHDCLLTGDMGIANTTASAALVAAFTGVPPESATGRGTGVDDETLSRKVGVVQRALDRDVGDDPVDLLASLGGLEHAGLVGLILGGAARRVPLVLDGMIAGSAALVAQAVTPTAIDYCVAGHRSVEPGHGVALARLGLRPLIDLDLRLGEGTGAVLAFAIVEAAGATLREMATFDSAGVAHKHVEEELAR